MRKQTSSYAARSGRSILVRAWSCLCVPRVSPRALRPSSAIERLRLVPRRHSLRERRVINQEWAAPSPQDVLFFRRALQQTRYIRSVRQLVRKHSWFFLGTSLVAMGLRLWFVFRFPAVVDDSHFYANIAENWLQHGVYAVTDSGQIVPTLSRLPGYPAFLAAIFAIFGIENFRAVLLIQALVDLGTCFLIADSARRLLSGRAARAAFLLAAICPFLANYAAAALTECLEIFFTALALDLAIAGLGLRTANPSVRLEFPSPSSRDESTLASGIWFGCGLAIGGAILLRPDGGILLASIGGYLVILLFRRSLPTLNTIAIASGGASSQTANPKPEA